MAGLQSTTFNGSQLTGIVFRRVWGHFKSTFTWRHQKYFWPVYLYWAVLLLDLYVSLWVLSGYLDPADGASQLLAVHNEQYAGIRNIAAEFLAFFILLSVPYYFIVKKPGIALQYAAYYLVIYYSYPYYRAFHLWSASLIADAIMCPDMQFRVDFCDALAG